ncbi:uncharacterized protein Z518_03402 [Rhinocladiella mackenziei CBS 650.93]|uniref:YMC020W-like alpha/beta hydrolase domain-containing protein n=1 Tax=Rhinocladiella mackenziei CBS 650.93 TaxID=1442369 RepID=A0A0D2JHB1_9EURO|nr:uncharacterized protein Z518_03402 [Rhinocladiella mackenziei CBS 650.93]KIX08745.1 hypothetical protein Z518_03402 [Rhinocladiella mackenziei CBS 650.93]
MAPSRPLKRQKTNPREEPQLSQGQPADVPLPANTPPATSTAKPSTSPPNEPRSSWISRTWPRKAPLLTEMAKESVSSTSNTTPETVSIIQDKPRSQRSPSLAMTLGKSASSRSLPANAATTIVNATPEAATPPGKRKPQSELSGKTKEEALADKSEQAFEKKDPNQPVSKDVPQVKRPCATSNQPQGSPGNWLNWLSKKESSVSKPPAEQAPQTSPAEIPAATPNVTNGNPPTEGSEPVKDPPSTPSNKRSWYQMWTSDIPSKPAKKDEKKEEPPSGPSAPNMTEILEPAKKQTKNLDIPAPSTPKSKSTSQASSLETSPPPPLPGDGTKSSGWVFWSRDKKGSSTKTEDEPHVGEIAISDTPSQGRPKRASISLQDSAAKPVLKSAEQEEQSKKPSVQKSAGHEEQNKKSSVQKPATNKQAASEQEPIPKPLKKASTKQDSSMAKVGSSTAVAVAREPVEVETPRTASPAPVKKETSNLLLPHLKDTLSPEEHPSILQQLARLLYYTKEPELKHLSVVKEPPRIKNALAIGVHGYFPAPLIRTVIGQPTGTSIKFADMAAKCIRKWTRSRGYDCEVKSAALEGEGRIAERVELLWKLLLNWIDEIRKSDFVMIACHSQGVPVAIMLVAKLIQFGCINGARVGICAMAGVNMGPFQEYKSRWISGSAGELFEFSDPDSKVSTDYLAAIEVALKFGVRLTYIGSIDDQLVPMESSIFAPITHPHIYRAVLIDSRIHAPNFLSHLVGFVLKLRNVGVPDHGLIKELSLPLAGSLYTGEGHSRIYEDDAVYDLAIAFALETSALKDVPITKRRTTGTVANPYILPFAMRGILEEDYVKKELQNEARELLAQFDDWKPTTRALKDVKFRLEGIRSKL